MRSFHEHSTIETEWIKLEYPHFPSDTCANKFCWCRWGAERRVKRAQTRERGPPLATGEFFRYNVTNNIFNFNYVLILSCNKTFPRTIVHHPHHLQNYNYKTKSAIFWFSMLPSSNPVGNFSWKWAELALLSLFLLFDPTRPDPTLKCIKAAFYSKTCFSKLGQFSTRYS